MTRYSKLNKTAFTALSLLSLPVMSLAQQTEEPAKSSAGSPLAIVMIGGLISSTILSRVVTPVIYKIIPPSVKVK